MDVPTLASITAMMLALFGALLLLSRGRGSDSDPLSWWGAAMITGAAGLVLAARGRSCPS